MNVDTGELRKLVFDRKRTFLKIPHKNFHTDFLPRMEGLTSFKEGRKKSEEADIGGVFVQVIALDDLIKNKRSVNRKTDRTDIKALAGRKNKGKKT